MKFFIIHLLFICLLFICLFIRTSPLLITLFEPCIREPVKVKKSNSADGADSRENDTDEESAEEIGNPLAYADTGALSFDSSGTTGDGGGSSLRGRKGLYRSVGASMGSGLSGISESGGQYSVLRGTEPSNHNTAASDSHIEQKS